MATAELAAVSFLARYAGRTHDLYAHQLRRWFGWCEGNALPQTRRIVAFDGSRLWTGTAY